MTPIHFLVPFWGEKYRHYFEDCLWRSLGPQLRPGDKVVVACPNKDAKACLHLPLTHIPFDPDLSRPVYWNQNEAQKLLLRWAFDHRVYASLYSPDMIISSNFVLALQACIDRGEDVIQCTALRQNEATLLTEIGFRRSFTPREVADLNIRHLHRECDPLFEGNPCQPWLPPLRLWKSNHDLIIHSFIGVPILMNFTKLRKLNLTCLKHLAVENAFLDKNFFSQQDMKSGFVTDSDELGIISLSPDYPSTWHRPRNYSTWRRRLGLQMAFYLWPRSGWRSFQQGAVWHTTDINTDLDSDHVLYNSDTICRKRFSPLVIALGLAARLYLLHFRPWAARRPLLKKVWKWMHKH